MLYIVVIINKKIYYYNNGISYFHLLSFSLYRSGSDPETEGTMSNDSKPPLPSVIALATQVQQNAAYISSTINEDTPDYSYVDPSQLEQTSNTLPNDYSLSPCLAYQTAGVKPE